MKRESFNDKEEHDSYHERVKVAETEEGVERAVSLHDYKFGKEPRHFTNIVLRNTKTPIPISYVGNHWRFVHDIFDKVEKVLPGIKTMGDPSMGSTAVCFAAKTRGWVPTGNDFSFLSYCIAKGFCELQSPDEIVVEKDAFEIEPTEGYFTSQEVCQPEVSKWVDGFALRHKGNYTLLAALGAGLLKTKANFRGFGWCKSYGMEVTLDEVKEKILLALKKMKSNVIPGQFNASWNDGLAFLEGLAKFPFDFVYMDPAWPWANGKAINSYGFQTVEVGGVLRQKQLTAPTYWTSETVFGKVKSWIDAARSKSRMLCLLSQTSNYPSAEALADWLEDEYGDDFLFHFTIDVLSTLRNRKRSFQQLIYFVKGETPGEIDLACIS